MDLNFVANRTKYNNFFWPILFLLKNSEIKYNVWLFLNKRKMKTKTFLHERKVPKVRDFFDKYVIAQ